ncbi:energy transducer TonB [Flavobacterium sp. PLA-1-15]|uniref:energy transducer TonB n=1 Tax=Flavobacterium sp. PLA-1-15 TaxID=3380533 RepID=UPI003B77655F
MVSKKTLPIILSLSISLLSLQSIAQKKSKQKKENSKTEKVIQTSVDPINGQILLSEPVDQQIEKEENIQNKVWHTVEVKPEYPDGNGVYIKYISENYNPPADSPEDLNVFAKFVVEKNGSLSDIQIIRSPSPLVEKEVIRILKNSKRWKPGIQNGKPVRTLYTLPIHFAVKK